MVPACISVDLISNSRQICYSLLDLTSSLALFSEVKVARWSINRISILFTLKEEQFCLKSRKKMYSFGASYVGDENSNNIWGCLASSPDAAVDLRSLYKKKGNLELGGLSRSASLIKRGFMR